MNQPFDNGNNELIRESDFIEENVLDTEGWQDEVQCPSCSKLAKQDNFDECLGGAINAVYSLDCPHCGYHECSREFCRQCESVDFDIVEEQL